jgi:hypothetical protein
VGGVSEITPAGSWRGRRLSNAQLTMTNDQ